MQWDDVTTWQVLIVDDEIDNLEVVSETLAFYGAQVKTARNGAEAIQLVEAFTPSLVLMDLSMPVMDGWEARQRLKRFPATQHVPVLALSAHAMVGDRERAMAAGFDGYLTKPVDVMTIISDIQTAIKNKV
jgi:CheY-like chemotaxis protein